MREVQIQFDIPGQARGAHQGRSRLFRLPGLQPELEELAIILAVGLDGFRPQGNVDDLGRAVGIAVDRMQVRQQQDVLLAKRHALLPGQVKLVKRLFAFALLQVDGCQLVPGGGVIRLGHQ